MNHVSFKFASYDHVYSLAIGIQIQFERRIIFSSFQNIIVHELSQLSKTYKGVKSLSLEWCLPLGLD